MRWTEASWKPSEGCLWDGHCVNKGDLHMRCVSATLGPSVLAAVCNGNTTDPAQAGIKVMPEASHRSERTHTHWAVACRDGRDAGALGSELGCVSWELM
jgi:hypothetical protein